MSEQNQGGLPGPEQASQEAPKLPDVRWWTVTRFNPLRAMSEDTGDTPERNPMLETIIIAAHGSHVSECGTLQFSEVRLMGGQYVIVVKRMFNAWLECEEVAANIPATSGRPN